MEKFRINGAILERYFHLQNMMKEIETELNELNKTFHHYFDATVGENTKGSLTVDGFKLQRQVRKTEKFDEEQTVKRLEELRMEDLIETVRRPHPAKVHAALELGLLRHDQVEDLKIRTYIPSIVVKKAE